MFEKAPSQKASSWLFVVQGSEYAYVQKQSLGADLLKRYS